MSPSARTTYDSASPPLVRAVGIFLAGSLIAAMHAASILREQRLAQSFFSDGLWKGLVTALGGSASWQGDHWSVQLASTRLVAVVLPLALCGWLGGAFLISRATDRSFRQALCAWGARGWLWWLLPLAWELLDLLAVLLDISPLDALLVGTLPLWVGMLCAGWLTTAAVLMRRPSSSEAPTDPRVPAIVWGAMSVYVIVFGAMNWGLYESLLLPHGDSAMYEEHLWNLLHGKGFRSYLDQGRLFLGEHVQVIHLLLIPAYLLWPSQVLLELCQSAALAAGAIPVYRIALRHGGSRSAAVALAIAYLLYVPMQFLDIAIDFKTFRPNSFEIPLVLAALDALERRRWAVFLCGLGLALLCQEDAATIIAPLGVWMAVSSFSRSPISNPQSRFSTFDGNDDRPRRTMRRLGAGLAVFATVYVVLVVKVVLPWFRGGEEVHFAQYFDEWGGTSNAIAVNLLRHPLGVLGRLADVSSIGFGLVLLAPLGFLPLLSPGRMAVGAPLFAVLCLSEITNSAQHHFHAPIVPVLFWAAAAGIGRAPAAAARVQGWWRRFRKAPRESGERQRRLSPAQFAASGKSLPADCPSVPAALPTGTGSSREVSCIETAACWCLLSSACLGFLLGMSPASLGFWDRGSRAYWRSVYVPGERARRFPAVLAAIPPDSRVASTDFIHPRFTHHARSYDYSDYRPVVPPDADYIVIDTRHPYSRIQSPDQVKELRDHPHEWELAPIDTGGYYILLRRVPENRE